MNGATTWTERCGGAALVTGASSGIGAAFARALAQRGMDLVLVARRRILLEGLARELSQAHPIRATVLALDLTASDAAETLQRQLDDRGISIGLLVNNAGFGLHGPLTEQNPARLAALVDLNCRAPLALARAFAPAMVARGKGGLIFVASTASFQPTPYLAAYGASKAFDMSVAAALWEELSSSGVDVLALAPGYTETEFQALAGGELAAPGGKAHPDEVVETALEALGRQPVVVHGGRNAWLASLARHLPLGLVTHVAGRMMAPGLRATNGSLSIAKQGGGLGRGGDELGLSSIAGEGQGRFAKTVVRMVAAFLGVALIDVVAGSLLTGKLRFWFPAWLDANWDRPDAWVVYSQSYLAGVFFIPFLAAALVREFLPRSALALRAGVAAGTAALLGFLAWWKGGLMVQHHKEREALAWLLLTPLVWGLLRLGEALPRLLRDVSARRMAGRLATGVALFFLAMAVIDPLLQLYVQRLPWSKGLMVELAFFIPAGLALAGTARRLRKASA